MVFISFKLNSKLLDHALPNNIKSGDNQAAEDIDDLISLIILHLAWLIHWKYESVLMP
jgi:hypothetical protein